MRCDECSCIYIDRNDYYKHMRNFHKMSVPHCDAGNEKTSATAIMNQKNTLLLNTATVSSDNTLPNKSVLR